MLGDLRAKDLSIISRASHSLKKVCWVFPFFDFYLQSLNDKWHDIQCMTHMGYWPLCRVLVRMVATSHVNHTNLSFPNPQTFLLIVSILVKVNWNLEKILRVSLPQKCSLPHPVGLLSPSRSKSSEWQKLPDTASESQTHGTWQQRRRSIRKTNSIMCTFNISYFWSQML